MSSVSLRELEFVEECIGRLARGRAITAACLYGSRVAGYARPDSDIDLLLVLERFPFGVTYTYLREKARGEVSALVVGRRAIESDAKRALLGEFVIGRLLHIYEPLRGGGYLAGLEHTYKKRVILEEAKDLVSSTGIVSTDLSFPLEFIHFAKIKRRSAHYPSAAYSYYKTYSCESALRNLASSLAGYERALGSIREEDHSLFESRGERLIGMSEQNIAVEKGGAVQLRLSKRLKQFGSYLIHTYAGLKVMHRSVGEAESKIKRGTGKVEIPASIADPVGEYCRLPEGHLIADSRLGWFGQYCAKAGLDGYVISGKQRLGNSSSRTILVELDAKKRAGGVSGAEQKLVVKSLAIAKSLKWSALNVWTVPVKRYSVEPLLLLGAQYKALRYLRQIGLRSPAVEAVVLDRKLVITRYVEGRTIAQIMAEFLKSKDESRDSFFIEIAGEQIAKVHSHGASFGNLKPKNIVVSGGSLYFTDLEQFSRNPHDQPWDVAQFLSWALKRTTNAESAGALVRKFLRGYVGIGAHPLQVLEKLASSRRHLESFYPVMTPPVARAIKEEIKKAAK